MYKLAGLSLIAIGCLVMTYVALVVLFTKGGLIVIGGLIPMVAGLVVFNMKSDPPRTLKEEVDHLKKLFRGFTGH